MSTSNCDITNCPMKDIRQTLADIATSVAKIDEHVTIYLGNSRPGLIPEQLDKMQVQVDGHETYIQQHKAEIKVKKETEKQTAEKKRDRWLPVVNTVGIVGALVAIIYHIAHMG